MKKILLALLVLVVAFAAVMFFMSDEEVEETPQPTQNEEVVESTPEDNNLLEADGEAIPDFTLPDVNGKNVSAFDEIKKNKLTIIDFWASWCGPCRAEIPNVVAVYEKYADKGLGIIGVSLDEDQSAWKSAIKSLNMKWTQLSDLQGWDNAAARLFGIESIPATILVNNKGQVVATDLRGEELASFVGKALQ